MKGIVELASVEKAILVLRGKKIMLDADLAQMYGVDTRVLIQAIKRNIARFPDDFMFQLTDEEFAALRSQSVISKSEGRGGRRYPPYAFTEHGVAMLASVLNSPRAIEVSVFIVRAFVRLREMATTHRELAHRFAELERRLEGHDKSIRALAEAIRSLMSPAGPKRRRIGFVRQEERDSSDPDSTKST